MLELVLMAVLLGLLPAYIAKSKGDNSFFFWWLYGFAAFLFAFPHALLLKKSDNKQCPHCAKTNPREAKYCSLCGQDMEAAAVSDR